MTTNARPAPVPDPESQPYWGRCCTALAGTAVLRRLRALRLSTPGPSARACLSANAPLRWVAVSGRGTVHSFAVMHESYMRGFDPPYLIAQVQLDEQPGLRLTTNLVECEPGDARIGMAVEVTFEDRDDGVSGSAVPASRTADCERGAPSDGSRTPQSNGHRWRGVYADGAQVRAQPAQRRARSSGERHRRRGTDDR